MRVCMVTQKLVQEQWIELKLEYLSFLVFERQFIYLCFFIFISQTQALKPQVLYLICPVSA